MGGWPVEMSLSWEWMGGGGGSNKGVFLCSVNPRMSNTYPKYMARFFGSKYLEQPGLLVP